jgi:hypothetical protein
MAHHPKNATTSRLKRPAMALLVSRFTGSSLTHMRFYVNRYLAIFLTM